MNPLLTSQQRFAQLSRYLPVLPVFGKGDTRFQPVYAGDIGRLVEILTRDNVNLITNVEGKIIEAAGPDGELFPLCSDWMLVTHIQF